MIRILILAFALAASVLAEGPTFSVFREVTLVTSADALTIQQAAADAKDTLPLSATFYCSVACTVTLELNGTAATATAGTVVDLLGLSNTSTTTAWTASNVGTGTVVSKYVLAAAATYVVDLTAIRISGSSTAKNLTVRVSSISGDFKANILWRHY